jgi:hypothetical protein
VAGLLPLVLLVPLPLLQVAVVPAAPVRTRQAQPGAL